MTGIWETEWLLDSCYIKKKFNLLWLWWNIFLELKIWKIIYRKEFQFVVIECIIKSKIKNNRILKIIAE